MPERRIAAARACLAGIALVGALAVAHSATAQDGPPAMPVSVAKPVKRTVVDWVEFGGRFEAADHVELRARVSGALQSATFKEGSDVRAGETLFIMDPRPFDAALRQAEANVEVAQTRVDLAEAELKRAQELRSTGNIPESVFQQRQQQSLEARASIEAAKAALEQAQLDREFSEVKAPIEGRVGQKLVTEGNLITGGSTGTLLTTIVRYDPIYFYFDIDELTYLRHQRTLQEGQREKNDVDNVYLALSDEAEFKHQGKLDFIGNRLDQATGTIRVRAVLDNPDNMLTPGLFGRVRVMASSPYEALVLPEVALMADQSRKLVMTVAADGTVVPKVVEVGQRIGEVRVIRSGLDGSEDVIVNGLMRARPGAKVMPQPVEVKVPEDLTAPNG